MYVNESWYYNPAGASEYNYCPHKAALYWIIKADWIMTSFTGWTGISVCSCNVAEWAVLLQDLTLDQGSTSSVVHIIRPVLWVCCVVCLCVCVCVCVCVLWEREGESAVRVVSVRVRCECESECECECVCGGVCVCVWDRERERERRGENVCVLCVCVGFGVWLCVLLESESLCLCLCLCLCVCVCVVCVCVCVRERVSVSVSVWERLLDWVLISLYASRGLFHTSGLCWHTKAAVCCHICSTGSKLGLQRLP